MNVGLLKTTLVNYPGRVSAAVFLPGCNLRCPFCHNGALATASVVSGPKNASDADQEYVPLEEAFAHLEKRAKLLGALAVSGGEPLLSPALRDLIRKARELGLAVKVDTNGTLPDRLAALLSDPETRPDMIAIDVKTAPERYGELAVEPSVGPRDAENLLQSLALLEREANRPDESEYPRLRVEYRTVLVPGLVGEAEIARIASLLPPQADWELAAFASGHCLDPSWDERQPYGPAETARLSDLARSLVPGARLR